MIPAKMISEHQDLQNYLQAPQNWSPSLSDVTKPPAILFLLGDHFCGDHGASTPPPSPNIYYTQLSVYTESRMQGYIS